MYVLPFLQARNRKEGMLELQNDHSATAKHAGVFFFNK